MGPKLLAHGLAAARMRRLLAVVLVMALLTAACSDSDDDSGGDSGADAAATSAVGGDDGGSVIESIEQPAVGGAVAEREAADSTEAPAEASAGADETDVADSTQPAVRPDAAVGESTELERPDGAIEPPPDELPVLVDTRVDEQSTFGLDVDTGSFTRTLALLEAGSWPSAAEVRIEEFVNAFDYGDPAPRDGTFAIHTEAAPVPGLSDRHLLRVSIVAEEVPERARDDLHLTLAIDVSGSMSDDGKLGLVIDTVSQLVDRLDADDSIALVAYEERAVELLAPVPGDRDDLVDEALRQLAPGGSTSVLNGLDAAYATAARHFDVGGTNRVVLLSDGVATAGPADAETILELVGDGARRGIELVTIGVGLDTYDDATLEQLAYQGDGAYVYLGGRDDADRVTEDLAGLFQTVAVEARAQVTFDDRSVWGYRLLGYENRAIADEDFRDDRIDAGELAAGHRVTALYELELAPGVVPGDGTPLAEVRLRWLDPETRDADELALDVTTRSLHDRFEDASAGMHLSSGAALVAAELRGDRWVPDLPVGVLRDVVADAASQLPGSGADRLIDMMDLSSLS